KQKYQKPSFFRIGICYVFFKNRKPNLITFPRHSNGSDVFFCSFLKIEELWDKSDVFTRNLKS
ncbi:hypothetical protein, partial [Enterococcus casseliflavus]|uniref:hypothetical protein n=1 Tax=Enterococcus casseliflavus TaxID=37734 RepID=UPI0019D4810A